MAQHVGPNRSFQSGLFYAGPLHTLARHSGRAGAREKPGEALGKSRCSYAWWKLPSWWDMARKAVLGLTPRSVTAISRSPCPPKPVEGKRSAPGHAFPDKAAPRGP